MMTKALSIYSVLLRRLEMHGHESVLVQEADAKYNQVKNLGRSHEEAEAAADRVWRRYGFNG